MDNAGEQGEPPPNNNSTGIAVEKLQVVRNVFLLMDGLKLILTVRGFLLAT